MALPRWLGTNLCAPDQPFPFSINQLQKLSDQKADEMLASRSNTEESSKFNQKITIYEIQNSLRARKEIKYPTQLR